MINELSQEELKDRDEELKKLMVNKHDFVSQYGKDAEKVMYGKAISLAKKQNKTMNKSQLNKIIKEVLSENPIKIKVGDKVKYLGYPAVITKINKEMGGDISYNILYDKGEGKTKASNISIKSLKETHDPNDPVTMAMRANRGKVQSPSPSSSPTQRKSNNNMGGKKVAKKWDLTLKDLYAQRKRIEMDMEQEAEAEGGPIADNYGAQLNKIDKQIARIRGITDDNTNYTQAMWDAKVKRTFGN